MKAIFLTIILFIGFMTLGQSQTKIADQKVDSLVKPWIGKPYRYGGTTKAGIDCSGFTQRILMDLGILIPRTAKSQYRESTKVDFCDLQIGDLLFFMSKRSPSGWHVAFYLGNGQFVHAANRKMGVIVQELSADVKHQIYSIGRFTK
jgi:cell wall-associated NlpC family hydrolase